MQSSLPEAEFARLVERTGLTIPPDEIHDIHAVFGLFEALVARVHAPRPREAEPATIFVARL